MYVYLNEKKTEGFMKTLSTLIIMIFLSTSCAALHVLSEMKYQYENGEAYKIDYKSDKLKEVNRMYHYRAVEIIRDKCKSEYTILREYDIKSRHYIEFRCDKSIF